MLEEFKTILFEKRGEIDPRQSVFVRDRIFELRLARAKVIFASYRRRTGSLVG